MSKQPPPAPTASAVGPCSTVIEIVGRPGSGSLPSTIAPPDHPPLEEHEGKVSVGGMNITNLWFADDIDALAKVVGWLVWD